MQKIRIGVVGLGHRGRHMIKLAADGFDFVEPVAACDIKSANWFEKQWLQDKAMAELLPNTKFYENYDQMLEEAGLDAVIVETGADIHADFCRKALKRNINVLSDIPIVANLEEADYLWKATQASKAILSVGANPNESKFARILLDLYQRGFLGKPYCLEAEYIHWNIPKSDGHIHLNENGDWRKLLSPIRYCTHSLGPLLAIVEEDLIKVSSFGTGQHADDYEDGVTKDDMVCAQFQTTSGVVVRLLRNGRCRAQIGHHSYRVFGTEGYFERIDQRAASAPVIRYNSTKFYSANRLLEMPGDYMPFEYAENPKATGHGGMDYAMLDRFLQALLTHSAPPISLREGLRMTLPGIYAEMSTKRGGEILAIHYPWNEDWNV
ncbi:MAG: Gfo/Idh/MocA family oxidoreductase [Lentisphaeria bacterium]